MQVIVGHNGAPSPETMYLFNGDIVDRGPYSCECILLVFTLKIQFSKFVFVNRGNHESEPINREEGFFHEAQLRVGEEVLQLIHKCFRSIPLATDDGKSFFVIHGGLAVQEGGTPASLQDLQSIQRRVDPTKGRDLMTQLLWNDPSQDRGVTNSSRTGWGLQYGSDITDEFLKKHGYKFVVRSHQEIPGGFKEKDRCITIFSANFECATSLEIEKNGDHKCHRIDSVKSEKQEELYYKWLGWSSTSEVIHQHSSDSEFRRTRA
ncbi:Metallo-dependent phosphatase-like protein [Colletotrichum godetiae]|uniref:Serine/threonine-protein phosphatase n=1 Tax=Colletotrichum godetiae TaxID=1209918 RepID=A0AAJ0A597_9PEZI|nr:Metallo-dependent phosphatase-like protein [Colletotrichum godetiae]KAK1656742.1 Metallo-dependent phosphatase-like protein [Colletotrichum godetiae]